MFKLVKWAYELGKKDVLKRVEYGLYRRLGSQPSKADFNNVERERDGENYNRAMYKYMGAADLLEKYFHPDRNYYPPIKADDGLPTVEEL